MSRRTWNTEVRSPWNPKIHNILQTIDLHTEMYVKSGDIFHANQAEYLRNYIKSLKDWIQSKEK